MHSKLKSVKPGDDYVLHLTYENEELRIFDMKPLLSNGIFKELTDMNLFRSVYKSFDTVAWSNEADIDPEVLYLESKAI